MKREKMNMKKRKCEKRNMKKLNVRKGDEEGEI